jgi:hypothetical protein
MTPERFKTMGFGVDLTDVKDHEIRAKLVSASSRVNVITAAPAEPRPHDFRGGTAVGERHFWNTGDGRAVPPKRQFWPWHYPLTGCSRLQIVLTNNRYIDIGETERYLTRRTIEIVSLAMTASGIFGAAIVPEIGLLNPVVEMDYTYGYSIPYAGELLEDTSAASDGLVFRAQDQWWTDDDVTVYVDGTEVTTGFTIDRDEGAVTFAVEQTGVVTADYTTRLPRDIAMATGILAAESLGDREIRARGMGGLRAIRVGEITLEKDQPMRGGQTLVTPAQAEAEALLSGYRFISAGA